MGCIEHASGPRQTVYNLSSARRYKLLIDAASRVDRFTVFQTWGFTDNYTWVPKFKNWPDDEPLLFDKACSPKPAFRAVHEALQDRLSTP